jgi:hypothetical protein
MTPRQGYAMRARKFLSTTDDRQAYITSFTSCRFVILLQLTSPVLSSFLDANAALTVTSFTEMRRGVLSINPSETINLSLHLKHAYSIIGKRQTKEHRQLNKESPLIMMGAAAPIQSSGGFWRNSDVMRLRPCSCFVTISQRKFIV